MKFSTRFSAAILTALAAACGGTGSNAALSKSFTYGAPQPPSSAETSAASTAQSNLSSTASFSAQPDATQGATVIAFADSLASLALGSSGIPAAQAPSGSGINSLVRSGLDNLATCGVVVGTGVTFTNCTVTEGSFTVSFSGNISVSANTVAWNIAGSVTGTDAATSTTINISHHQAGSFTVTATTLKGNATSDVGGTVTSSGQTIGFGVATAAVIDLTYVSSPSFCVTNGTVEVKRVWTQKPNGATGAQFADAGVKISWNGCNTVLVAHSQ